MGWGYEWTLLDRVKMGTCAKLVLTCVVVSVKAMGELKSARWDVGDEKDGLVRGRWSLMSHSGSLINVRMR